MATPKKPDPKDAPKDAPNRFVEDGSGMLFDGMSVEDFNKMHDDKKKAAVPPTAKPPAK